MIIIITRGLHLVWEGIGENLDASQEQREGGRGKWKVLPRATGDGGTYFGTGQVTVCWCPGEGQGPRKRQRALCCSCCLNTRSDWLDSSLTRPPAGNPGHPPKTEASSVHQLWTARPITPITVPNYRNRWRWSPLHGQNKEAHDERPSPNTKLRLLPTVFGQGSSFPFATRFPFSILLQLAPHKKLHLCSQCASRKCQPMSVEVPYVHTWPASTGMLAATAADAAERSANPLASR